MISLSIKFKDKNELKEKKQVLKRIKYQGKLLDLSPQTPVLLLQSEESHECNFILSIAKKVIKEGLGKATDSIKGRDLGISDIEMMVKKYD